MSIRLKILRILIYVVITLKVTQGIFIYAPEGEFFDNETKIVGIADFLGRINFPQIFVIFVPVFLIITGFFESVYFVLSGTFFKK